MLKRSNFLAIALAAASTCPQAAALAQAAPAGASDDLRVGAAVRDITPAPDMLPLTRAPNVTIDGYHDPIHLRVIALTSNSTTALIVASEIGRGPFGPQFAAELSRHTGLPIEAIFMAATHSHGAPEIGRRQSYDFGAEDQPTGLQRWGRTIMDALLSAADEALADRRPATVGVGYSESYINMNRLATYNKVEEDGSVSTYRALGFNPTGPTDRKLATIRFMGEDGQPIAFIVDYAVHGTVMHANTLADGKTAISSDIPGAISTMLEKKYGGSVAVWLSGAAGDQNPIIQNDVYSRDPMTGEFREKFTGNADILEYLARIHFADTEKALAAIDQQESDATVNFDYAHATIPTLEGGDYPVSLQLLRIGDIALMGFPGELFSKLGLDIKQASPLADTIVVNHTWQREGQNPGYHADDASVELGGFGTKAVWQPGTIAPALAGLARELVAETDTWQFHNDGTASNKASGQTVILGLDGRPGTEDDGRIVNPAGKVLLAGATLVTDGQGRRNVSLGGGLSLHPGPDARLGTRDDVVRGIGRFVQDAEGGEVEPIDWLLLDIEDGKALLASAEILDAAPFSTDGAGGWPQSNLRSWLNSGGGSDANGDTRGFLATAFTGSERARLLPVAQPAGEGFIAYDRTRSEDNWQRVMTPAFSGQDKVSVLSGEEVFRYFGPSRIATQDELSQNPANYTDGYFRPTRWAHTHGVKINTGHNGPSFAGFGDFWTRSPGREPDGNVAFGTFLGSTGSLNIGRPVTATYGVVPVISVRIDKPAS